jgi:hypothetical protein
MTLKPASPSARPTERASSYSGSLSGVRAEPKTDTAGPIAARRSKPERSSRSTWATRSSSVRVDSTAGASAVMISSSGVAGACRPGSAKSLLEREGKRLLE